MNYHSSPQPSPLRGEGAGMLVPLPSGERLGEGSGMGAQKQFQTAFQAGGERFLGRPRQPSGAAPATSRCRSRSLPVPPLQPPGAAPAVSRCRPCNLPVRLPQSLGAAPATSGCRSRNPPPKPFFPTHSTVSPTHPFRGRWHARPVTLDDHPARPSRPPASSHLMARFGHTAHTPQPPASGTSHLAPPACCGIFQRLTLRLPRASQPPLP